MRSYSTKITFSRNSRGVYSIDPSIGCASGMNNTTGGCYGDCYAARSAKIYGYDFSNTVYRYFKSIGHVETIKKQICRIDMPFIRMGTMGDPSEDWSHTLDICELLQHDIQEDFFPIEKKEIVIITKHWNNLTLRQLLRLKRLKVCINTSVSAMDKNEILNNSMAQFERVKPFCRSILRVVTCDFNKSHPEGRRYSQIQEGIITGREYIDTVFRPSKNNKLVSGGIIHVKAKRFIKGKQLMSKLNKRTYLGKCDNCKEMCGVNL